MFLFFGEDGDEEKPLILKIKEYVKKKPKQATAVLRFWFIAHKDPQLTESNAVKAANVLLTLGEEISGLLFGNFSKADIKSLNQGIKKLSSIIENHQIETLLEFYELCKTLNPFHLSNHHQLMEKLRKGSEFKMCNNALFTQQNHRSRDEFQQITSIDNRTLAHVISREHPQTIAVILAYIESHQRAHILAQLPAGIQVDVCIRIARLDQVDPLILRSLKETLMQQMKGLNLTDGEGTSGVSLLAELLNNMDPSDEDQIFDQLSNVDPSLADRIRNEIFTFDDLVFLDDRGMQTLLKEIDKKVLVLALKSSSEEVKLRLFNNISKRAIDMILDDIDALGLVRMSEVKAAQAIIVETALKLEAEDKLTITKLKGEDEFV